MRTLILNASPKKNGATGFICETIEQVLHGIHDTESICLGELSYSFCIGCKECYTAGKCVRYGDDDVEKLVQEIDRADNIIIVAPSYWADVPAQMKAFIDRCTPYCNNNPCENRFRFRAGKTAYAIALRTGPGEAECKKIISTIDHFLGHLEIKLLQSRFYCGIADRDDMVKMKNHIEATAREWFS